MAGVAIGVAALAGVGVYTFVGGFKKAVPVEDELDELTVMVKLWTGSYGKTAHKSFKEASILSHAREDSVRLIALYYDDPMEMKAEFGNDEKCRAMVGCVLDDIPEERRKEAEAAMVEAGYSKKTVPKTKVVKTSFRLRGGWFFIPSVITFLRKAYPALQKYCEEKALPMRTCIELYSGLNVDTMTVTDEAVVALLNFAEVVAVKPVKATEEVATAPTPAAPTAAEPTPATAPVSA